MSGKKNDILISLESLIDEGRRESVSKVIALLEGRAPRIQIDREYQKSLRDSLISPKKQKKSLQISFPWFTFISSIWVVSTCFIAAFWLYTMWTGSWNIGSPLISPMSSSDMMYSEEKAERFSWGQSPKETIRKSLSTEISSAKAVTQIHPATFKAEKASIDNEISDIQNDIMDTAIFTPLTNKNPPESINMMQSIAREATPQIPTTSPPAWAPRESIMKISPSLALTQSLELKQDMTYPSIMKIYTKPTHWLEEEILSRSWSGLIEQEVSTEKYSIIKNRYDALTLWKKSMASTLIYVPMMKISRNPKDLYYLIPALQYTLEWWEKITLPLIRGYK